MNKTYSVDDFDLFIFDWDGSLEDSMDLIRYLHDEVNMAMTATPQKKGRKLTNAEFKHNSQFTSKQIYPLIYPDDRFGPGAADRALKKLAELQDHHAANLHDDTIRKVRIYEGTMELLQALHAIGKPMCILSNKTQKYLHLEVKHFKLDRFFTRPDGTLAVYGAEFHPNPKPAPDPVFTICNQFGVAVGKRVVIYGDTRTDMGCGRAAGITLAYTCAGRKDSKLIREFNPEIVVAGPQDFSRYLGLKAV